MATQEAQGGTATADAAFTPAPGSLLEKIMKEGNMARDPLQNTHARDLIAEFAAQVLDEGMVVSRDTAAMINSRIAQIDQLISDQLNEVMHDPDFQKLEGSWRGLAVPRHEHRDRSTHLKLRLLNASRDELQKDLEKAVEFDQSVLFKKIYEEEYGTFGGHPFSCWSAISSSAVIRRTWRSLEKISNVAAAAHAPFIAAASPKLFDLESFTELSMPRDLAKSFESSELIKWRSLPRDRRFALRDARPAARPDAPAVRSGHAAGRRRRTSRKTSNGTDHSQVPVGQRRVRARAAHHDGVRAAQLVRGDPRRGRRRSRRGTPDAHVQDR